MRTIVIDRTWDGKPAEESEIARLSLRFEPRELTIEVDAPFHGDPAPVAPPGRCDELWEYEVVELFLVGRQGRYLEIELGPHGHYLALQLSGVRRVDDADIPVEMSVERTDSRWICTASCDRRYLPEPIERWNAFAIHGGGVRRHYLAASALPGAVPDFHRLHLFPPFEPGD